MIDLRASLSVRLAEDTAKLIPSPGNPFLEDAMLRHECEICGDETHAEGAHGEALTVLQPSLHDSMDWIDTVVGEAEAYANTPELEKRAAELRKDADALTEDDMEEFGYAEDDILREAEDIIHASGYHVANFDGDSFLVFGPVK